MASPPVAVEDEADEDFFDKLVDDDFEIKKPGPVSGGLDGSSDLAEAFPSLSISGKPPVVESGNGGDDPTARSVETPVEPPPPPEREDIGTNEAISLVEHPELLPLESAKEEEVLASEETSTSAAAGIASMEASGSTSFVALGEAVPADTASCKIGGSGAGGATSGFKEVDWSAFHADGDQQGENAFGSASDFFSQISGMAIQDPSGANFEAVSNGTDQPVADSTAYYGFAGWQSDYSYGGASEQTSGGHDMNSSQYLEKNNPGWWLDSATGQWYQTDSAKVGQENFVDDGSRTAGEETVSSLTSDVSYLQQTSESAIQAVTENGTTTSVSNWNLGYAGSIQYPPHMVFDPQYPEWYYDTNAQNWFPLKSYTPASSVENSVLTNQASVTTTTSGSFYGALGQATEFVSQALTNQDQTVNWSDTNQAAVTTATSGSSYGKFGQASELASQGPGNQGQTLNWNPNKQDDSESWNGSASYYSHQNWATESAATNSALNIGSETGFELRGSDSSSNQISHGYESYDWNNAGTGFNDYSVPQNMYNLNQSNLKHNNTAQIPTDYYGNQNSLSYPQQDLHASYTAFSKTTYSPAEGRSSAGRPPHALVSFGFGGKLIVMKCDESYAKGTIYASQEPAGASVSILNLSEVVMNNTDLVYSGSSSLDYFRALCQQSFPGPLVGGNAAAKEVNKWIDERITNSGSMNGDLKKAELIKLLLSLLKISCQQYGRLRSPFGADSSLQDTDGPEAAITKLFASAKRDTRQLNYGTISHCMQNVPSEAQIRASAVEVQNLLVAGRRKEALHCAQESQLWGPALILATQLGHQFYADTVKQMAHRQFLPGSPLRTLCLLIAGEPADVFSDSASAVASQPNIAFPSQQPLQISPNGMLDDWEENLAIITANRTKDDELVIVCLGDQLWKERDEIVAAHICYLVAEASFESYSNSARLCLVGADHLKYPRTYATPEAIQRTEVYEYSKLLGNSQYILQQFLPYKIIYAYMLAEVGKVSDSLRYCQAIAKTLKNPGRLPEIEAWKSLISSLEECIRAHQQGGYSTNLATGNLVGKFINSIDKSISRMIGTPPAGPATSTTKVQNIEPDNPPNIPKVDTRQPTMSMPTMIPSASMEPISAWAGDTNRMTMPNRSISEPDFASPKEVNHQPIDSGSGRKTSVAGGTSRFGRFGTQFLQKTMGWVSRSRQAKLGEENKFYYDEKLKTWVEEGAEPPAGVAALPPPPTTASFHKSTPEYNISNAFKGPSPPAHDGNPPSHKSPDHSSGIPPVPPTTNQFSARSRMGVRSRYVDTFNKGGGTPTNLFHSPPVPAAKPVTGANFFVPTALASSDDSSAETIGENIQDQPSHQDPLTSDVKESSSSSASTSTAVAPPIPRFQSLDNISSTQSHGALQIGNGPIGTHSRAASWSGTYPEVFNHQHKPKEAKPSIIPSRFIPSDSTFTPLARGPSSTSGGSFGDDLQDVDL